MTHRTRLARVLPAVTLAAALSAGMAAPALAVAPPAAAHATVVAAKRPISDMSATYSFEGQVGTPLNQKASDGVKAVAGKLPKGVKFRSGAFVGTPRTAGVYKVRALTKHPAPRMYYELRIARPDAVQDDVTIDAVVGTALTAKVAGVEAVSGARPEGVRFSKGTFTGTPTTAGHYVLRARGKLYGYKVTRTIVIEVAPAATASTARR